MAQLESLRNIPPHNPAATLPDEAYRCSPGLSKRRKMQPSHGLCHSHDSMAVTEFYRDRFRVQDAHCNQAFQLQ